MRIATMKLIAAFAAVSANAAEEAGTTPERNVTVCMSAGSSPSILPAQVLASKMFAAIGVTIHWRFGLHGCLPQASVLSLSSRTPADLKPGSLAYALPYEGLHVLLFYDRIIEGNPKLLIRPLLAHVLVHEITHLLQAENRHSESGITKAHWGPTDYDDMRRKPLAFTAEDIDLIYRGLAARDRAMAALNAGPAAVAAR